MVDLGLVLVVHRMIRTLSEVRRIGSDLDLWWPRYSSSSLSLSCGVIEFVLPISWS
ncbi:hypothetical protein SOVF_054450 [Spinacia oleracea]|nr:hypothetical protein SOVF_054450 [Spinacia oleracea]